MTARLRAASLVVCAALVGLLIPGVARAQSGGGIGVRAVQPANAAPSTDGFMTMPVAPGAAASGSVVISNTTAHPVSLDVYATDGTTAVTAGAVYGTAAESHTGAAAWVSPAAAQVQVPAGSQQPVAFDVRVPAQATPGDHVVAIVVETPATASSANGTGAGGVMRDVVPIDVRVPGAAQQQARLSKLTLSTLPGTSVPSVIVGIGDTGGLVCRPTLSVTVTSAPNKTTTATRSLDVILPGDSIAYPFALSGSLPAGSHQISATVTGCGQAVTLHATGHTAPSATRTPTSGSNSPKTTTKRSSATAVIGAGPGPLRGGATPLSNPAAPTLNNSVGGAGSGGHGSGKSRRRRPRRHRAVAVSPSTSRSASGLPAHAGSRPAGAVAGHRNRSSGHPATGLLHEVGAIAGRSAFPVSLLVILVIFVLVQDQIDRRDPKLALAPAYNDPQLPFSADPWTGE